MVRIADAGLVQEEPSAEGLAKVAAALGADPSNTRVRRLSGGIATSVHVVDFNVSAEGRRVVIKRFPPTSPTPQDEWSALEFAARSSLPSPTPLLLDSGGWFGAPCIVTEYLPGQPELTPVDPTSWIDALTSALAGIHATPVLDVRGWLHRPAIWQRWDPRGLAPGRRTTDIADAVDALRHQEWTFTFCHGDFHPGNVLFENGACTGVVDWSSARAAPALSDVGRMRAALSIWPGGDVPDLFAAAYTGKTGRPLDGLAFWDTLSGTITLANAPRLVSLYEALGVALTVEDVQASVSDFVDRALQQLPDGQ